MKNLNRPIREKESTICVFKMAAVFLKRCDCLLGNDVMQDGGNVAQKIHTAITNNVKNLFSSKKLFTLRDLCHTKRTSARLYKTC